MVDVFLSVFQRLAVSAVNRDQIWDN